uniref:Uncharacterized protein n=1 Tax=Oryza sativa subsp. japonica TaxID=39947 RepID=Q7XIV0_ORYSJ|nr:hypothetical protein [Oryza sativa Japonica Group]BAD30631.1 hypothetical protein [Oryza sativa Japonica Group]
MRQPLLPSPLHLSFSLSSLSQSARAAREEQLHGRRPAGAGGLGRSCARAASDGGWAGGRRPAGEELGGDRLRHVGREEVARLVGSLSRSAADDVYANDLRI